MRLEGINQALIENTFETLRLILEKEQARPVALEEAFEVGESLITFFEVLASESQTHEQRV